MSKRRSVSANGAMLELWRPPQNSGEPVGCLATTYTFSPGLFDEQCLARFLEIDSEPNREDLAFLLERESRLGSVYAGVLVDHSQAGVEHSLRWDVLPVRIPGSKQHAKISILAWQRLVRVIVASANLTEPGYRYNYEVAAAVELTPNQCDTQLLTDAVAFLRRVVGFVPGAKGGLKEVARAFEFLDHVEHQVGDWKQPRRGQTTRQLLVFTLPAVGGAVAASSLEQAIGICRQKWGSPEQVRVASPFFDLDPDRSEVTAAVCKMMARGGGRKIAFSVPAVGIDDKRAVTRLAAPKSLLTTPPAYQCDVSVDVLPEEEDKNRRPWHAKMLEMRTYQQFTALMIGSSNFTGAGMGVGNHRNAEANLVTIADHVEFGRDVSVLRDVWPAVNPVEDPDSAEWLGAVGDRDEDGGTPPQAWPPGFLAATYRAGEHPAIVLMFEPDRLPPQWSIGACGRQETTVTSAEDWRAANSPEALECPWALPQPPEKVIVRWDGKQALIPLNVEDSRVLPAPPLLEKMTANDMLGILAASDPSAAYRSWARQYSVVDDSDDDDAGPAVPIDLDPLRRFDLQATFLHRIRRRARVLAQLRENLQRPVSGLRSLEWRLRGLIGVQALAERLAAECISSSPQPDEALLTLSDFLIVLREVKYEASEGALSKPEFDRVFRRFMGELADKLDGQIQAIGERLSKEVVTFWTRVVERCHE